jgi:hypothetical protein
MDQNKRLDLSMDQQSEHDFFLFEVAFLTFYILELALRFFAFGPQRALNNNWTKFDAVIICVSIIVLPFETFEQGQKLGLGTVILLRAGRLFRVFSAIRLVGGFRQLGMLMSGWLASYHLIASIFLLLSLIVFLFALIGVELITLPASAKEADLPPQVHEIIDEYFPNVLWTMLTLMQFVLMDSIDDIYRPLIRHEWKLVFYFVPFLILVAIVFMNIITGTLVNSVIEQAGRDKEVQAVLEEKQKKMLMRELYDMLIRFDHDNSGEIDSEELLRVSQEDLSLLKQITEADPVKIFNELDLDGTGKLGINEFCEGLYMAAVSKAPAEMRRTEKMTELIRAQTDTVQETLDKTVTDMLEELRWIANDSSKRLQRIEERSLKKKQQDATKSSAAKESQGKVQLDVLQATDLRVADHALLGHGSSDPYVCIRVEGSEGGREIFKTKVVKRSLNPVWDESTNFNVGSADVNIVLMLFDKDNFSSDDPLGLVRLSISDILKQSTSDPVWYDIQPCEGSPVSSGRIKIKATCITAHGEIMI